MNEIIYILTNEAMPEYVKIGFTNGSVEKRLRQLDGTNVPLPFECYYACEVENARKDEDWLHSVFADRRVRDKREFFKVDPEGNRGKATGGKRGQRGRSRSSYGFSDKVKITALAERF